MASGRTIVIAVDGSPGSQQAFHWALHQFLRVDDCVVLLHVFPHFVELATDTKGRVCAADCKDVSVKQALDIATVLLEGMQGKCREHKISVHLAVESGDARGMIPVFCQQLKAHCLVMGSRGLGSLQRLILGSVSDYCVHNCSCPVLVVRPRSR